MTIYLYRWDRAIEGVNPTCSTWDSGNPCDNPIYIGGIERLKGSIPPVLHGIVGNPCDNPICIGGIERLKGSIPPVLHGIVGIHVTILSI